MKKAREQSSTSFRAEFAFFVLLSMGPGGCAARNSPADEQNHISILDRDTPPAPEGKTRSIQHPPLPPDLRPEHRSLMLAYERFGFPTIRDCIWARRACDTAGWFCDDHVLEMPWTPRYGTDSDEDLPHWVRCDNNDAETTPKGLEDAVYALFRHERKFDEDPKKNLSDLNWFAPPRDSRHLVWTTFAHWALERHRRDLFDLAIAEAEKASSGRCPKLVKDPLSSAVLANAAASFASAAKRSLYHGNWEEARAQATRALHLLSPDSHACKEGPNAYLSARAALRRAELELTLPVLTAPPPEASTAERLDYWLVTIMRQGLHSGLEDENAIAAIRAQGEAIVPLLLPHMSELALHASVGDGWFQLPETVGDVVVTIIEDIAGQEFASNRMSKSMDLGAHLAIYAWWAGRQKALEEADEATKPKPLWDRIKNELGFER